MVASRTRAAHLGPERRRPQILEAARDIAVSDGIAAVTIGSVAARLEVTRPVIYACYGDREAMLDDVVDTAQKGLLEHILAALHSTSLDDDPRDAFRSGFQALLQTVRKDRETWRFVLGTITDPVIASRFGDARKIMAEASGAWIRPGVEHWWDIDDLDRKLPVLIDMFVAICESSMRWYLDHEGDADIDELSDLYATAMVRILDGA